MTEELELRVLQGLKEATPDRYIYALMNLEEALFTKERLALYKVFTKLYQVTQLPPDAATIQQTLDTVKARDLAVDLESLYASLNGGGVTESEFRASVYQLIDAKEDIRFSNILAQGLQINARPTWLEGKELFGRADAKRYIVSHLNDNKETRTDLVEAATDNSVIKDYYSAKEGKADYLPTGLSAVDRIITGMERGDLVVVEGFLGSGKTTVCLNVAHNALMQGKNVVYGTTETIAKRIIRKLWCRHSYEAKFKQPLPYSDLKFGRLTKAQEEVLEQVKQSLSEGRQSGNYGAFYVAPINGTASLEAAMNTALDLEGSVDLAVADYLAHLSKGSDRVSLVETIIEAKYMAVNFNQRHGVPIITPWQTSLNQWEQAKKTGYYKKGSMAETTEIEKAADVVLTILQDEEDPETLLSKLTKVRDDAEGQAFKLHTQMQYSYIGDNLAGKKTSRFKL